MKWMCAQAKNELSRKGQNYNLPTLGDTSLATCTNVSRGSNGILLSSVGIGMASVGDLGPSPVVFCWPVVFLAFVKQQQFMGNIC